MKIDYSFDDEIVRKFSYDLCNRKIEICFSGYYTLPSNQYINKYSIWTIENWIDAKSKLVSQNIYEELEHNMGIISLILSLDLNDNHFHITVNTLDDRYVDLLFIDARLSLF